jgi:hypothetical protein
LLERPSFALLRAPPERRNLICIKAQVLAMKKESGPQMI